MNRKYVKTTNINYTVELFTFIYVRVTIIQKFSEHFKESRNLWERKIFERENIYLNYINKTYLYFKGTKFFFLWMRKK